MLDAASTAASATLFPSSDVALFQPSSDVAKGAENPAQAFSQALDAVRREMNTATVRNGVWDTTSGSAFRSSMNGIWANSSGQLNDALGRINTSLFGGSSPGNGIWKPTTEAEKLDYKALVERTRKLEQSRESFMLSMAMFKLIGSYPVAITKAANGLLKQG